MSDSFTSAHTTAAQIRLLGDDNYAVMLTNAGSGYSMWRGQAVTRWRSDPTCDAYGSYVLLRDVENNDHWSATMQPFAPSPGTLALSASPGHVTFSQQADGLECKLEVAVVPSRSGEVRRMTVTNTSDRARIIELVSYAELVLGSARADASHPAFSKMFVQTEVVDDGRTLLAHRRKRVPKKRTSGPPTPARSTMTPSSSTASRRIGRRSCAAAAPCAIRPRLMATRSKEAPAPCLTPFSVCAAPCASNPAPA